MSDAGKQARAKAQQFERAWAIVGSERGSDFSPNLVGDTGNKAAEWRAAWIERANQIEAAVAKFVPSHRPWTACGRYGDDFLDQIERLPGAYKKSFRAYVDDVMSRDPGEYREAGAAEAVEVNAKLAANYRYKEKELEAVLVARDQRVATEKARDAARFAKTRCSRGGPVGGRDLELVRKLVVKSDAESGRKIVKAYYRLTHRLENRRSGLISYETKIVAVCRKTSTSHCLESHVRLMREKPPGNPWTSWQADFRDSGSDINCKNFK